MGRAGSEPGGRKYADNVLASSFRVSSPTKRHMNELSAQEMASLRGGAFDTGIVASIGNFPRVEIAQVKLLLRR